MYDIFLFYYFEKAADKAEKTEEAVAEEEGLNYIFTLSNQFFTCLLVKSHGRSEYRPWK